MNKTTVMQTGDILVGSTTVASGGEVTTTVSSGLIGSEQVLSPGTTYSFPVDYSDGQVTIQVKSNLLGTYAVITEVQTLLSE